MIVKNIIPTLEDDSRGFPADGRESAIVDWMCISTVIGDDGKKYWLSITPFLLKRENVDMIHFELNWDTGEVCQDPLSIYKLCKFPNPSLSASKFHPGGTCKINKQSDKVTVDIADNMHLTCYPDNTWHYNVEFKDKGFKADLVHTVSGSPHWYGQEKPSYLTAHSVTYGYNWTGNIEGTLTIGDKVVHVKGSGIRERYLAIDTSSAEIGGWEDWGWFHFDEAFGSFMDFKLGMKESMLNLVDENIYFPEGALTIEHHDWAFFSQYGGFIPTVYKLKIEVDAGVLEMTARAASASATTYAGKIPDSPCASFYFGDVQGTFTYKDGRQKKLTNGFAGNAIRQWRAYPIITPPMGTVGLAQGMPSI